MALSSSSVCPRCGGDHKSKPFATYSDGFHCFSCGAHKSVEMNYAKPRPKLDKGLYIPQIETNPLKFTTNILKWLLQYHLTYDQIKHYYIAEAIVDSSLVIPVVVNNSIIMYQRRWACNVCGQFSCACGTLRQIRTYGVKQTHIVSEVPTSDTLVVVEDYISAIRVGYNNDCMCLFGTSLSEEDINKILSKYNTVIIWLDNDQHKIKNSGQVAAQKIKKRLERTIYFKYSLSHKKVFNIVSNKDPKWYTNSEIRDIICSQTKPILKFFKS